MAPARRGVHRSEPGGWSGAVMPNCSNHVDTPNPRRWAFAINASFCSADTRTGITSSFRWALGLRRFVRSMELLYAH